MTASLIGAAFAVGLTPQSPLAMPARNAHRYWLQPKGGNRVALRDCRDPEAMSNTQRMAIRQEVPQRTQSADQEAVEKRDVLSSAHYWPFQTPSVCVGIPGLRAKRRCGCGCSPHAPAPTSILEGVWIRQTQTLRPLLPDYLVRKLSTGTGSNPVQLAPRHQKTYNHAYFPRHHEPIDSADIKRPD